MIPLNAVELKTLISAAFATPPAGIAIGNSKAMIAVARTATAVVDLLNMNSSLKQY
jgi:hypothetical protein